MGGAMDLVSNPDATRIVVTTDHINYKDGSPKIVEECSLPLTGARVVSTIITDLVSRFFPNHPIQAFTDFIDLRLVCLPSRPHQWRSRVD
jgi:hypothetical protein